jgi:hypothetical protein
MQPRLGPQGLKENSMTEEIILDHQTITHMKAVSDAGQAFAKAIEDGRLSDDDDAPNYAGRYMFMGYQGGTGKALFKHIDTRQYID